MYSMSSSLLCPSPLLVPHSIPDLCGSMDFRMSIKGFKATIHIQENLYVIFLLGSGLLHFRQFFIAPSNYMEYFLKVDNSV